MKQYSKHLIYVAFIWFLLPAFDASAQQDKVTGSVTDRSARPVAGATITLAENPNIQARTDADGYFTISAEKGQNLRVTGEGGARTTVTIPQDTLDITLGSKGMVPVGYGDSRGREKLTSAVGMIDETALPNKMVLNSEDALYGLIPGLTVLQNGGTPPTSVDMYIRGVGTFNNSSPLVLVDGFERPLLSSSNLGGISVEEIESISLLKDAAALARYGHRGANGVLLITTKRGNVDGLQVNASMSAGITRATRLPSLVNAPTYARAINEALANDGQSPRYRPEEIAAYDEGAYPHLYPNVDWFDEVLRNNGVRSNFNVNFRGGGTTARYYATMNVINDEGLFDPLGGNQDFSTQLKYSRFNFRSNLDINLRDDLVLKLDATGNIVERNLPNRGRGPGDIFDALYSIPSGAFPVRTPDGNWGGTQRYDNNPVAILNDKGYGQPNSRQYSLTGKLQKDLGDWVEGLSAEAGASYFNFGSFNERYDKSYSYEALSPVWEDGDIVDTTRTKFGQDTDLDFVDSFGSMRIFSDFIGKVDYRTASGNNIIKTGLVVHQSERIFNGQNNTFRRRNFTGNVHVNLGGKYLFDVTASYSGNNILPEGNRYTFFPAVSAAWILTEEAFLQNAEFLDHLKLRASWGMIGNDLIPANNPFVQSYDPGGGYWLVSSNSHQGGFSEGRLPTSNFTVEKSYVTNLGIESRFFGKLDLTADLFYERRTNILTETDGNVSDVIGVPPPLETDGIVENKGVEVATNWVDNFGDVTYRIGGQFSFARNKIVEMNEQFRPHEYLRRTGQPVGQSFGLVAVGFFEDQDEIDSSPTQVFSDVRPGDIKYKDQNGDGIVNEFDEVALGHSSGYPEIYYSFNIGLNYRGFDLSALFQGTENYTAYLNTQSVYWPLRNDNTVSTYYHDNRWTPETAGNATLPRLTNENIANNFRPNSVWLVDRSYLKLRTLEVSYSLPGSVTRGWNMDEIRIFAQGINLFSIDNIETLDPEHLAAGYPIVRSYNMGIEVSF